MVADHEGAHPRTYGLDHAGRFVAQHHRRERRKITIDQAEIAVAHAAMGDANQDFAAVGVLDHHIVTDLQREAHTFEDSGSHRLAPIGFRVRHVSGRFDERDDARVTDETEFLATLLDAAVDIVRQAGEITLEWFQSATLEIERKGDGTPVTQADKAAERFVREQISSRFGDDTILGEEEDDLTGTSERTWIIDPIDGTKAFTHGVPLYTNLLAVNDATGPAIGIINMPALGEMVYAARGLGCFVNGRPARVSDRTRVAGSYLSATGFDYWSDEMVAAARASGAALRTWGDGYGYALVATGRIDAMCDPQVALWDVAPMPVILAEAGGRFTDLEAGTERADLGSGLATNGHLHDEWLERFRGLPRR